MLRWWPLLFLATPLYGQEVQDTARLERNAIWIPSEVQLSIENARRDWILETRNLGVACLVGVVRGAAYVTGVAIVESAEDCDYEELLGVVFFAKADVRFSCETIASMACELRRPEWYVTGIMHGQSLTHMHSCIWPLEQKRSAEDGS
jgi:hypothetical protein